jgi:hypothetical protein
MKYVLLTIIAVVLLGCYRFKETPTFETINKPISSDREAYGYRFKRKGVLVFIDENGVQRVVESDHFRH